MSRRASRARRAALARGMSEDFMESGREQPEQQDRPDTVFQ
ncbi:VapB protein (antitoxin to VapC) [Sinorhizobium alkalisoli]|nr:VapB protein (antitoxin to VapC) [Sinorhizobium alkalisoli]